MKMSFKHYSIFFLGLVLALGLSAQENPAELFSNDLPRKSDREFQFLAYYINQAVTSDFYPENVFMKGQVIGRLFGDNTTHTSDSSSTMYFEQRLIPFFIYQPKLFNGKAILRAAFEIDWTWGDASYGAGGNLGSAISADYVNIQTQNIELELIPYKGWTINLGLQRLYDTPYNPYRTYAEKMMQTGYRLAYWGTDAVGITVRHDKDYYRWKAGFYQLYENNIQEDDDVTLMEFTYEKDLTPVWEAGASLYYIRDRANGEGGVSIYSQGLNSKLTGYNGTFRFDFGNKPYKADIAWLGLFAGRNADLMMDRYALTAFFNYNLGKAKIEKDDEWETGADIGGFAANIKASYRYGQTTNDAITLEGLYSSGDDDALIDKKYSGVITGNTWGAPAGIFIGTGAYLLFPHSYVVNRFTPAVADISNMGYGLTAAVLNISRDFIPYTLNAKIGTAWAISNVEPSGGGKTLGNEINGSISYNLGPFMSISAHAAYLALGDFYDSNDSRYGFDINGSLNEERPVDPWTVFLAFKWLMF